MMNNLKSLIETLVYKYLDNDLYEMANLQPKETGLKTIIHVMHKGGAKHGPRVKVSNIAGRFAHDDNFSVTAENEPRVVGSCKLKQEHLEEIRDWVKKHKDHLHKVWHHGDTMTSEEIAKGFGKL